MTDPNDEFRYEITVWNWEGDIVRKEWDADEKTLDEIEGRYGDEPMYTIIVDHK